VGSLYANDLKCPFVRVYSLTCFPLKSWVSVVITLYVLCLSFSFHLNPDFYPSQYWQWREDSDALVLLNIGMSKPGETFTLDGTVSPRFLIFTIPGVNADVVAFSTILVSMPLPSPPVEYLAVDHHYSLIGPGLLLHSDRLQAI
jgi:hypothetical protein